MIDKIRAHIHSGVLHNLEHPCKHAEQIFERKFTDYRTEEAAILELKKIDVTARRCKKCKWANN